MKIGILTFHNIPNIGALLQAYSLCKTLRKLGADCEIVDYRCENIVSRELMYHPKSTIISDIIGRIVWRKTTKKIERCKQFMREKKIYSSNQYDKENISDSINVYDTLISGSDMIWNLDVTNHDYTYFLDFADDRVGKYSYGSSIGGRWSDKDVPKIKKLLQKYNHISVRETDTCDFIKNIGLECEVVADPTMLLSSGEWSELAELPKIKDYVLVYFPTRENKQAAKRYAKKHGKKVVLINMWLPSLGFTNVCPYTPPEWIGYFKNACAVFTDSYHGLLFSLYLQKPVWTGNYGNRIVTFLESMNLKECLIKNDMDFSTEINYEEVNTRICNFRKKSMDYIIGCILDQ